MLPEGDILPLRRETFEREAVYIAIGIKPNGHKEVIGTIRKQ